MGYHKIMGGINETKKEAARKQNTENVENRYNSTHIKCCIYGLTTR